MENKFKTIAVELGYRLGNVGIHWNIYKYGRYHNSVYLMYWRKPDRKYTIRFSDHTGRKDMQETYEVRSDLKSGIYNGRVFYNTNDIKGLILRIIKETV